MFDKLAALEKRYDELSVRISDPEVINNQAEWKKDVMAHSELEPIIEGYRTYKKLKEEYDGALEIIEIEDDPEMKEIEVALKPNLSPQQNAAKFYKDYTKAKHAEKILAEQIAHGEMEEKYLAAVLDVLNRAENERDLSEIRAELEAGGYVRALDRKKQQKIPPSKPMAFVSSDGYRIFVGRNNRQNDLLSLKTARKDDLWLHVQKFHGTHVIIDCHGTTPPDETITEAAQLAAYYSEAREGQNVSVDITSVRNLKKPNGAKPGMVVYERYRTVIVTPDPNLPVKLSQD